MCEPKAYQILQNLIRKGLIPSDVNCDFPKEKFKYVDEGEGYYVPEEGGDKLNYAVYVVDTRFPKDVSIYNMSPFYIELDKQEAEEAGYAEAWGFYSPSFGTISFYKQPLYPNDVQYVAGWKKL